MEAMGRYVKETGHVSAVRVSMGWHPMAYPDTHPIFFTYLPMASMWVVTLHSLFLYSDPPLPCHPPSYWLRLFSSQTFSHINAPTFLKPSHSSYLPAHEDGTECSETLAYKIQMPGNYPEESIQHSKHGESLKSRKSLVSARTRIPDHPDCTESLHCPCCPGSL